jgi:type I restriction enzyme M protein
MKNWMSISEAAGFLGVSKATLRNWDKEGKLKALRHPINKYRGYDLANLKALKFQLNLFPEAETAAAVDVPVKSVSSVDETRDVRRTLAKLHSTIRDVDGSSSLLERFDEMSKLLFLWLSGASAESNPYLRLERESDAAYVARIKKLYVELSSSINATHKNSGKLLLSDEAILAAGKILSVIKPSTSSFDIKGLAYEEVIRGTFDKSDNQQFFTPKQVVRFMVSAMAPFLHGKVCDPACGTAGFLSEVLRQKSGSGCKLVGAEIDSRLAWISSLNLRMHGADKFEINYLPGNGSLAPSEKLKKGSFNAIITNPPFGSDVSLPEVLERFDLGKGRASRRRGILFVEACHGLLCDGGILSIVIDEGVLNLPSARDVREYILSHFEVMAVVSLPDVAFMPYANVATSILFLKKKASKGKRPPVFFAKADKVGRKPNGDDDVLYSCDSPSQENSDLQEILVRWNQHLAGEEISHSEGSFQSFIAEGAENPELRIDFKYHHPARLQSSRILKDNRDKLKTLAELCDERNDSVLLPVEYADQNVLYTGLANIEVNNGIMYQELMPSAALKSAVKRYEPGDILFARMRPNLKKVAFVGTDEGGFTSAECYVLKVKKKQNGDYVIDPNLLAALLRSDFVHGQIMHLVAGIGRPRLNVTDMRGIRIPVPEADQQVRAMEHYRGRVAVAREMKAKASFLMSESSKVAAAAVEELASMLLKNESNS